MRQVIRNINPTIMFPSVELSTKYLNSHDSIMIAFTFLKRSETFHSPKIFLPL